MTEEFQSILLEDFPVAWPGFLLRRVALNQHMPRVEKLSEHVHPFHQVLVYLRGHGTQHIGAKSIPVERGSVLVVSPGSVHRFFKERALRPVCLAIDFDAKGGVEDWLPESRLTPDQLARIEKWLVALHEQESNSRESSIQSAALILRILSLVEETVSPPIAAEPGPVESALVRLVEKHGLAGLTPGVLADLFSCTLDHLNRRLRSENGKTVGEFLRRFRLKRAGELLRVTNRSIGEVGSAVGIDDQNYFARWFRQHTGQTPTHWRGAMRES